jgi:hypothetical protein
LDPVAAAVLAQLGRTLRIFLAVAVVALAGICERSSRLQLSPQTQTETFLLPSRKLDRAALVAQPQPEQAEPQALRL